MAKERITVSIELDTISEIQKIAKKEKRSKSATVDILLNEAVKTRSNKK